MRYPGGGRAQAKAKGKEERLSMALRGYQTDRIEVLRKETGGKHC